jgi:hypothetical protein
MAGIVFAKLARPSVSFFSKYCPKTSELKCKVRLGVFRGDWVAEKLEHCYIISHRYVLKLLPRLGHDRCKVVSQQPSP